MKRTKSKPAFSHLDGDGRVRMVDVSAKRATVRRAVASGEVVVGPEVFKLLAGGGVPKGDVLTTAKIAGIQAAKRTSELIPLCHGLAPDFVDVKLALRAPDTVTIAAEARINAKTGVEMEALAAVSIAALTVYDMCKSVSKNLAIRNIALDLKTGGKSGVWRRFEE